MSAVRSSIRGLHRPQRKRKATQEKFSPDLSRRIWGSEKQDREKCGNTDSVTDTKAHGTLQRSVSDSGQLAIVQHRCKLQKGQEKADDKNVAKLTLQGAGRPLWRHHFLYLCLRSL